MYYLWKYMVPNNALPINTIKPAIQVAYVCKEILFLKYIKIKIDIIIIFFCPCRTAAGQIWYKFTFMLKPTDFHYMGRKKNVEKWNQDKQVWINGDRILHFGPFKNRLIYDITEINRIA